MKFTRCKRPFSRRFLLIGVQLLVLGVAYAQTPPAPTPPAPPATTLPATAVGAPVIVDGRTLFYVPSRMFTFSPEDRARAIAERVQFLSQTDHEQDRGGPRRRRRKLHRKSFPRI